MTHPGDKYPFQAQIYLRRWDEPAVIIRTDLTSVLWYPGCYFLKKVSRTGQLTCSPDLWRSPPGVYFSPVIAKGAWGDYFSHVDNCITNLTLLYFTSASVMRDSQRHRYPGVVQKKSSLNCCKHLLGQYWELPGNANLCSLSYEDLRPLSIEPFLISILGFCFSSTVHHKSDQIAGFLFKTFPSKNKIWSLIIQ